MFKGLNNSCVLITRFNCSPFFLYLKKPHSEYKALVVNYCQMWTFYLLWLPVVVTSCVSAQLQSLDCIFAAEIYPGI